MVLFSLHLTAERQRQERTESVKSILPMLGLYLLVGASAVFSQTAPGTRVNAPTVGPTVRISTGVVRGVSEGGGSSFKGIPFAAAPIRDNRWRPPQPLPAWQGVRDASNFGAVCAQAGFTPGRTAVSMSPASSEDCLFINVWRPSAAASNAKLPVM